MVCVYFLFFISESFYLPYFSTYNARTLCMILQTVHTPSTSYTKAHYTIHFKLIYFYLFCSRACYNNRQELKQDLEDREWAFTLSQQEPNHWDLFIRLDFLSNYLCQEQLHIPYKNVILKSQTKLNTSIITSVPMWRFESSYKPSVDQLTLIMNSVLKLEIQCFRDFRDLYSEIYILMHCLSTLALKHLTCTLLLSEHLVLLW